MSLMSCQVAPLRKVAPIGFEPTTDEEYESTALAELSYGAL